MAVGGSELLDKLSSRRKATDGNECNAVYESMPAESAAHDGAHRPADASDFGARPRDRSSSVRRSFTGSSADFAAAMEERRRNSDADAETWVRAPGGGVERAQREELPSFGPSAVPLDARREDWPMSDDEASPRARRRAPTRRDTDGFPIADEVAEVSGIVAAPTDVAVPVVVKALPTASGSAHPGTAVVLEPAEAMTAQKGEDGPSTCKMCDGSGQVGLFGYEGAGLMKWECSQCGGSGVVEAGMENNAPVLTSPAIQSPTAPRPQLPAEVLAEQCAQAMKGKVTSMASKVPPVSTWRSAIMPSSGADNGEVSADAGSSGLFSSLRSAIITPKKNVAPDIEGYPSAEDGPVVAQVDGHVVSGSRAGTEPECKQESSAHLKPARGGMVCAKCNGRGKVGFFGALEGRDPVMAWPCDECNGGVVEAAAPSQLFSSYVPRRGSYFDLETGLDHGEFFYQALDGESPDTAHSAGRSRQTEWLPLLEGWELVPEDDCVMREICRHPWGCDALVVATGKQYYTKSGCKAPGEGYLSEMLKPGGAAFYRPSQWSLGCPRVLVRCPLSTAAAARTSGSTPPELLQLSSMSQEPALC